MKLRELYEDDDADADNGKDENELIDVDCIRADDELSMCVGIGT